MSSHVAGRRRAVWPRVMKQVRRVHLYTGLFLVPWVLLYGVTGYLFNHPSAFQNSSTQSFELAAPELAKSGWPELPEAESMARAVVEAWNADRDPASEPLAWDASREVELSARVSLSAGAGRRERGASYSLDLDGATQVGRLRVRPARAPAVKPPIAGARGLEVGQDYLQAVRTAGPRLFADHGVEVERVRLRSSPVLRFAVASPELGRLAASYRLDGGRLSFSVPRAESSLGVRRFLTRMHKAHSYPMSGGVRSWWAVIVDVMSVAMVLWGLSGVMMWWQIRALRRVGLVVIGLCVVCFAILASGMWDAMQ